MHCPGSPECLKERGLKSVRSDELVIEPVWRILTQTISVGCWELDRGGTRENRRRDTRDREYPQISPGILL